jgi:O-antigen ligase
LIPRRVRLAILLPPWLHARGVARRPQEAAWLAFVLHGVLILTAQYQFSFDAYTHMFFGDHYRLDWWSLWEPRWYTGFSVTSYPPLVHQLIGLLGHLTGVDAAFAALLWATLTAYPLAVYAFSRVFVGRTAAGYAALGAAVTPSVYLAAHAFGQLPTLMATLFALFGVAALAEFLRHGGRLNCALALALFTVVMAAHHATLLFLPWVVAGLAIHLLLNEKMKRSTLFSRLGIFLFLAVVAGLAVIWPFWAWGRGQGIQTPIDHPSRHNFFTDSFAVVDFFLPVYGPLMVLIPFALWMGLRQRRYSGLAIAFLPLFILGLGDTTPLPRILFRAGWEWLTYDRFAFWASLALLPFFGLAMLLARQRLPKYLGYRIHMRFPRIQIKRRKADSWPPMSLGRPRRWVTTFIFIFMALIAMIVGKLSTLVPFEPAKIDMKPIVSFLARKNHAEWRYLTFGFGDQLAYLSTLTKATTIDGSYHTARPLPELRESGIAQIDTAFWTVKGLRALNPILKKSGEHGVRWGFVSLAAYIPVLKRNGWVRLTKLDNGIQVWENPSAVRPEPAAAPPYDPLASFSWGVFPLLSLAVAAALAATRWRPLPAQKVWLQIHQITIGILPVGLCFWYTLTLVKTPIEGVYFTYTDGLLFASDVLALVAFFSWLIARFTPNPYAFCLKQEHAEHPSSPLRTQRTRTPAPPQGRGKSLKLSALSELRSKRFLFDMPLTNTKFHAFWNLGEAGWGLALCLLASLSILWSTDWRISLFVSLHLWLVFGVFLSVRDRPKIWRTIAIGFCVALTMQILIGFWQFSAQSTAFLHPLGLNWPGQLDPSMPGASVVQLPDGLRWLRVYGTLPHPNMLGGFVLLFLAGPAAFFLLEAGRERRALVLFLGGVSLLVLTFSRSAWVGLAAAGLVLVFHSRKLDGKRLLVSALAVLTGLLAAAVPLYPLIFTRAGPGPVATEEFSNEARGWLIQSTLNMIRDHPLLGVGVGAYIVEYARRASYGYLIEPVHNLPLLVVAELGIAGALIVIGLGWSILSGALRAKRPETVVFSAVLVGLLVTSLFDHYLWTLAPGQMLLGLALGLWAGQIKQEKETQNVTDPL